MIHRTRWTEAELATAAKLYHPGSKMTEIAASLGRNPDAVAKQLTRSKIREGRNHGLGDLDGPAIGFCRAATMLQENAISGSERLLRALQRTGVRP
jgi:hypothetical protein